MLKLGTTGVSTTYKKAYLGNILVYDGYAGIKTTPNSNNYTLNNSAEGKNKDNIKIGDGPELKQHTTEGKNKINIRQNIPDFATSGLSYTKDDDGTITIRGTTNRAWDYTLSENIEFKAGETYTLSAEVISGTLGYLYFQLGSDNGGQLTISNDTRTKTRSIVVDETKALKISIGNERTVDFKVRVQLEPGSTKNPYEKYTGGIASPNPAYPQAIKVVEGASSAKTSNKNKFNGQYSAYVYADRIPTNDGSTYVTINSQDANNVNFTINSNRLLVVLGGKIAVTPNTEYTLSFDRTDSKSGAEQRLYIYKVNANNEYSVIAYGNTRTFTTDNETNYVDIGFAVNSVSREDVINIKDIYLKEGSIATPYIAHKGKSFDITLPEGMFLGSIDTASNFIYGTKDNWKLHGGLVKVIIDENANITIPQTPVGEGLMAFKIQISNIVTAKDYCFAYSNQLRFTARNYVEWVTRQKDTPYTGALSASSGKEYLYCRLLNSLASTVAELKTYLSNNNWILYHPLVTPTETDITDTTLITQLNNIADNLQTYKEQTIVFTTSENLEPNIQFNYRAK